MILVNRRIKVRENEEAEHFLWQVIHILHNELNLKNFLQDGRICSIRNKNTFELKP